MSITSLDLENLSVSVGTIKILHTVSFSAQQGEFITIFGPNGAGKSTLLNIVAGLQSPTSGTLRATTSHGNPPRIGMVFQNYDESMLPWHSVYDNLDLVLQARAHAGENRYMSQMYRANAIDKIFSLAGITALAHRTFSSLSGGQKQLAAICRALIVEPDLLLLDEPFSALDYMTSRNIETTLLQLWQEYIRTHAMIALCISHNPDNALLLADRVLLLSRAPATIAQQLSVTLPRPRSPHLLTDPAFTTLRSVLLTHLEYEYAQVHHDS